MQIEVELFSRQFDLLVAENRFDREMIGMVESEANARWSRDSTKAERSEMRLETNINI